MSAQPDISSGADIRTRATLTTFTLVERGISFTRQYFSHFAGQLTQRLNVALAYVFTVLEKTQLPDLKESYGFGCRIDLFS